MKHLKKSFILLLLVCSLFLSGCDKKSFSYSTLTRDSYNTGGNLSFSYDSQTQTAYFGGEGEVVQFYDIDIAKGWTEKGCRVGVVLNLPTELKDYKSATATINNKKLTSQNFIVEIDSQTTLAIFQPIVNQENNLIDIKITWAENTKSQNYTIVIKEGTLFMNE